MLSPLCVGSVCFIVLIWATNILATKLFIPYLIYIYTVGFHSLKMMKLFHFTCHQIGKLKCKWSRFISSSCAFQDTLISQLSRLTFYHDLFTTMARHKIDGSSLQPKPRAQRSSWTKKQNRYKKYSLRLYYQFPLLLNKQKKHIYVPRTYKTCLFLE
jgi:hypothetical protein